jgi:hypothetical protein
MVRMDAEPGEALTASLKADAAANNWDEAH